jgi:hypothetical protein
MYSNLLPSLCRLKKCNPQVWLPSLTLIWGIVSIGQGLVKNQAGLFGIRFCMLCYVYRGLADDRLLVVSTWCHRSWPVSRCNIRFLSILSEVRSTMLDSYAYRGLTTCIDASGVGELQFSSVVQHWRGHLEVCQVFLM